jgi:hypothetical protein
MGSLIMPGMKSKESLPIVLVIPASAVASFPTICSAFFLGALHFGQGLVAGLGQCHPSLFLRPGLRKQSFDVPLLLLLCFLVLLHLFLALGMLLALLLALLGAVI